MGTLSERNCRNNELDSSENYSGDDRCVSPHVYPYANVRSVCTAFYVLLREGWSRLCLSPLLTVPRSFSQRTTGVFMGLLYDRSRPLGGAYTRTRGIGARPAYDSARVLRVRPLRIGRVRDPSL